ncbi:MAG: hybrid sensor histidine kinase/response regulator [Gloeocapsa sp. DLM2.Bin57]|nr:MAG: hybrid sensor histidine kinase/response regulator [Gloeocapsa sp. DLM2.Bin57]
MINHDRQGSAYQFFIEEVPELLHIIETGLLNLKSEKTTQTIHEVMRAAHSLKGGAASVDLDAIKTISHRLEDYFKALYSDEVSIDDDLESLLLQGYDCLRLPLLQQIETGGFDEQHALAQAEPIFTAIEAKLGKAITELEDYIPSSSDLGIDIADSLFDIDVAQIIETLDNQPASETVLREQIEMFAGFGELLNLPGVKAITEAATAAITANPGKIKQISQAFQANVQTSRELVLAGDRDSGGEPSNALLSLAQISTKVESPPSNIDDQAYQFFIEEALELLDIIEAGILTLKEEKSTPTIHSIMRAAHSLKGGAASVDLEAIKTISHHLEDYFKALYSEEIIIDEDLETLLLQGYDCLRIPLLEQIETGSFDQEQALLQAENVFQFLDAKLSQALAELEDYIPSSSDLGIDMVASIFEIDVEQELSRLAAVIATPEEYNVIGEARALIDVCSGFGELLNLPGFRAIGTTALTALELHPEQALTICRLMLTDYTLSREQVLAGDRQLGGKPSPELIALTTKEAPPTLEDIFREDESLLGDTFNQVDTATPPNLEDVFTETEDTSLLEDTFNQIETQTEDTSLLEDTFNQIETQTPPSLEDVFREDESLLGEDTLSESGTSPNLEDIFTETEDTSLLEDTFNQIETQTPPSLEDVFREDESLLGEDTLSESGTSPNLEDVFTETDATPLLENNINSSETAPSLENVFGDVETPASLEDIFTETNTSPEEVATTKDNLETVVESIENIFEKLPEATDIPSTKIPTPSQPAKVTPPTPEKAKTTPTTASNLSVRIDLNRIERINNLIGELAINRNSLSLQNEQLQKTVRELMNRFSRFQNMNKKLRELSDQMLISPFSQYNSVADYSYIASDFDTLEMDSYGTIHSMLQGLLEEMIQLEEAVEDIALFSRQSNQSIEEQRQMLTRVRDELMWARMLPLSEVLNRFPRVLRDLSTNYHKQVKLKLSGTGVLVDRVALEKLYDPLLHLLRNAFDHGIETPEERVKKNKPSEGIIEVKAYHQGNQTIIEIKDDGGGINLDKIAQKVLEKELLSPEQIAVASREQLLDFIFTPGFSTADKVSELSGRGVGLDVVRSQISSLKGTVNVNSNRDKGTTFTLRLPLTLTIAKLLVCLVGTTPVAIPSDSIEEIIIPQSEQIRVSGKQRFLQVGNQIIPAYSFKDLLAYNCSISSTFDSKVLISVPTPEDWALPFLIIRRGQQIYALEVERLLSEQELVIKAFSSTLAPPSYTYGCTILGDGSLIPVINGAILLELVLDTDTVSTPINVSISKPTTEEYTPTKTGTILVVDDSAAMRRTLALTLEKAGYRVISAKDGREALDQLQGNFGISLVICDIEMPNMNGFEFLTQRRRDRDFLKIPVAMLTSRSNDKHRRLAMQLGANAYFTKPYIEQQFLKSIQQIINQEAISTK